MQKIPILSSLLGLSSFFLMGGIVKAATIIVPTDQPTIQTAINAATAGDTIQINNGTYSEGQITITNKALTIEGASAGGVIINSNSNSYAILAQGGGITFRNLVLNGNASCTAASCYGFKIEGANPIANGKAGNYTLENITVNNSYSSGIDLNGVSSASLSDITVNNTVNGNGIALTDSTNTNLNNITTSGNAWGGVAFYAFGSNYTPATATGMTFAGTFSASETYPIYYERGANNNATHPITITPPSAYTFRVMDNTLSNESSGTYATSLTQAINIANTSITLAGVPLLTLTVITDTDTNAVVIDEDSTTPGFQSSNPIFNSLTVVAQDLSGTAKALASDGKYHVKNGDRLYFTLGLNPADTFGTGSHIDFTIGGSANQSGNFTSSSSVNDTTTQRNKTFTISSGNGDVIITGVDMEDFVGLDITGVPATFPATNIVVDNVAPIISNVSINSPTNDTTPNVSYDVSDNLSATVDVTVGGACTASNTGVTPGNGLSITLGTLPEGTHSCTITATDLANNTSTVSNFSVVIDTTDPTVTSVTASETGAQNVSGTEWLNNGDQICYQFNFSETVQITINNSSTANSASTRNNDFTTGTDLTTDTICFTVSESSGDNGTITPNVDFTLADAAGNTTSVTSATVTRTYIADTIDPVITFGSLVSSNAQSPNYARTNDTITVNFTVTEINGVQFRGGTPTILGASATSNLAGGVVTEVSRFTDGNEITNGANNDEVFVDFNIRLRDYAGNNSTNLTAASAGVNNQMQYDETDPVVTNIRITSTDKAADTGFNAAFTGDQGLPNPMFYANEGDDIEVTFSVCDYSDSNLIPPTGTFMGQNITLNEATHSVLSGTPCDTGIGTNQGQYRVWTYNYTPTGADPEGQVTFSFDITDNAGNNNTTPINITQASTAYQVIYDLTEPDTTNLDVNDLLGDETVQFKPRSQAIYSWNGDEDPTANAVDTMVSGIYSYIIDYIHSTDITLSNELDTEVILDTAGRNFTPAEYRFPASNFEYEMFMKIRDKAGNISNGDSKIKTYSQKYTVAVEGIITDKNTGQPIEGALVKVAARFNEECLIGFEICTGPVGITRVDGSYSVMVRDDANYTVSMYHPHYHMAKFDIYFPLNANEDFIINPELEIILHPHLTQGGNQIVQIHTSATYTDPQGKIHPTFIDVASFSGEISTKKLDNGTIEITSLGRINSVTTNNANLTVLNFGNNVFQVLHAGTIIHMGSNVGAESIKGGTSSFGGNYIYRSGSSRIGSIYHAASGKANLRRAGMTREEFRETKKENMTYEESITQAQRMNEGFKGRVDTYINRNGYRMFQGYVSGRLAEKYIAQKQRSQGMARKTVKYRRDRFNHVQSTNFAPRAEWVKTQRSIQSYTGTTNVMGEKRNVVNTDFNRNVVTKAPTRRMAGSGRSDTRSTIDSVRNKRDRDDRYHNPYRWNKAVTGVAPSRMAPKNLATVKIRVGNKRASLSRVLDQSSIRAHNGYYKTERQHLQLARSK